MNAKQVLNKIITALSAEKAVEMTYAKLADGTILESPTFDVGEDVEVVSEDGTKSKAPDGEHEVILKDTEGNDVRIKVITKDGKITERENVELAEGAKDEEVKKLPEDIDFPIPGNDDARRSINLYCDLAKKTILDAKQNIRIVEPIEEEKPKKEPNDPLVGDPRMKGRRWMIDPYWDDGKTFKKIAKMKKLNEFDKWTDTEHNDWDVSYREFYEHLTEEVTELTGGVGDTTAPSNVDTKELAIGVQVEMEHTNDPKIATEIAMDHLTEDPEYYSKLVDAGLATEFKPTTNSGLGDPKQSLNDKSRVGNNNVDGGNMGGTIGKTSNGQVEGRRSNPIVDKTVEIDIEEPTLNEAKTKKKKKGAKATNSKLWSRAKSLARSKFDVYPSAYANAWAAKWYKSKGGSWR